MFESATTKVSESISKMIEHYIICIIKMVVAGLHRRRHALVCLTCAVALLMVYRPLHILLSSTRHSEYYSHIISIPLISLYFIYRQRESLFQDRERVAAYGGVLMTIGILSFFIARSLEIQLGPNDYASLVTCSAVILINGSFILFYGSQSFRLVRFPLLFLIFLAPIPGALMDRAIHFLQVGSSEFSDLLFQLSGVPFYREGFIFHFPGMSVEVAKQCSGIRSSLALLITSVLAGHMFLERWWHKGVLVLSIIPITIFKNGIRIMTLTLLGVYMDQKIITDSSLHTDGGILFFIVGLLLMAPILFSFRSSGNRIRIR